MAPTVASDRPLKVGIDLAWLGERAGGVGRYATELPGALLEAEAQTELTVYVTRGAPRALREQPWASAVRWVTLPSTPGGAVAQLAEHAALPVLAAAARLDVLHSPANVGPVIAPGRASVITLMDLIWRHHATDWERDPRARQAMRRQIGWAVRHADRVLAISHAAAIEIAEGLEIPRSRLDVTPLGVRAPRGASEALDTVRRELRLVDRRVVLCVSQKRRYKNLGVLVQALPGLPEDVVVVLPGASTAYELELRELASELGVTDRVRFPEWVSEARLQALYEVAHGFALPTLAEGFGLPVLEAMTHGVPVACSDLPVLREVGGDAAIFFDPRDPEALARAICQLLDAPQLRATLRARGRAQAARYTWKRTGEATLNSYRNAIADRCRS